MGDNKMSTAKNNSFSTHHLFKKNNPANRFSSYRKELRRINEFKVIKIS